MADQPMGSVYALRCSLVGHEEDVRCLCATDTGIATGSRDKTIKLWTESGPTEFACTSTLVGHTDYVSALAYAPPGLLQSHPEGTLVSGSRDTSVVIWDVPSASPATRLLGHQYQVSAVALTPTGDVVSASLDKTLRLWPSNIIASKPSTLSEGATVLQGHEAAVLSLVTLPDGEIVSGSGDCTIRVWSAGQCIKNIPAHSDSVRGLALLPGIGLISSSHDGTLKVWTLGGDVVSELVGHTALVYCAAASADGTLIASGSEDCTVKIWTPEGDCVQTIEHPGNIWSVLFLPNGDLVTACSDGVARVWSTAAERAAPEDAVQALQAAIDSRKAPTATEGSGADALPAGLKLEDPSVLQLPGERDGQTKIVREGNAGVAYSWNAAASEWEKIGEVVSGTDSGNSTMGPAKKWYNGKEWDYVFDVDISDGVPTLKLALNADENPYFVADRFIEANGLSDVYREQIVQFILQNTSGGARNAGVSAYSNVDPYTGGSSYVPTGNSAGGVGASTTAGIYNVTGGGCDPYTGSRSYTHIPSSVFLEYTAVPNPEAVKKKLLELHPGLAGDPADVSALDSLLGSLCRPSGETSTALDASATEMLSKLLSAPAEALFPALDLARLAVVSPASVVGVNIGTTPVSDQAPPGSLGRAIVTATAAPALAANQQTLLRLLCNCFIQQGARNWMQENAMAVLVAVASTASAPGKNVRQGLASLLVNYAVLLGKIPGDMLELKTQILILAIELLSSSSDDIETCYRALLAAGTLGREHSGVRATARDLGLVEQAAAFKSAGGKLGEVASEVEQVMKL